MIWESKSLESALGVRVENGIKTGKVQFNSQDVSPGDLFIALPGQRDGHEFVADAFAKGASCAIVSQPIPGVDSSKLIIVDDTMSALTRLAEYKRITSKAKFIAITGSVGKTSTREVIKMMLESYGKTYASSKSFNNFLGVPLTLASMPDETEFAVIELGMNAKGELSDLTKLVAPDIAVITTISEGHIEFFDSIEEIADAKCEIFEGVIDSTGVAIINRDMSTFERCIENIDRAELKNIQTFGEGGDSNVKLLSYEVFDDNSVRLKFDINSEETEIIMPNISSHLALNFAAGFSVVKALNFEIENAALAIRSYQPLMGRGRFVEIENGNRKLGIICDYYNSNPQSLKASLGYFQQFTNTNKIAVLGDMGELGTMEMDLHKSIVPDVIESGASKLFLIGAAMNQLKDSFPKGVQIKCYPHVEEMIVDNNDNFQDGDLILIKGSRRIKLDKLAKSLGVQNVL
jgi:UDP-N-acetylmuramoyl-tripeptide--D-alanyl-D-alanine ligase